MAKNGKLTNDRIDLIVKAVKLGLTYDQAARFAGIGRSTFYRWKARGENAKSGKYRDLWDALKAANVAARLYHLKNISEAAMGGRSVEEKHITRKVEVDPATGDKIITAYEERIVEKKALPTWQASAWILERRFPDEFGKHIQPKGDEEADPLDRWLDDLNEAERLYGDKTLESD